MAMAQASFYSVGAMRWSGSEEVSDWRRWKFNAGHFEEWRRERSRWGAKLTKGEGRWSSAASILLLTCGEGWPTAVHGTVTAARGGGGSAKWRREMIPSMAHLGPEWAKWPGDMGRLQREWARATRRNGQWAAEILFRFKSRIWVQRFKYFQTDLNWGQAKINLNILFRTFQT
jgi:hypothetical protein